ncbi:hypothetical protein AB0M47_21115 [Hamadaea sp. NPDC051192]|uniref:hypothetical protein n=1 Tax=Hamadaea sp. NPDC051192 TaxID=3154940 RepID=UPI00342FFF8C
MAKMTLKPGAGGNFGFSAGGIRASASGNPMPYLLPWLLAVAMVVLAVVVRFGLASDSAFSWMWSVLTAAVYAGFAAITWRSTRPRGNLTCTLATGGVAVGGLWSWVLAGLPDLTWRPFAFYGLLAILACGGANVYTVFKHGPGEPGTGMFDKLGGALEKVRGINEITTTQGGQVKAAYQMEPGVSATELQESATAIASMYNLPPDAVRIIPSKDNANAGQMVLAPHNPLKTSPPWPGPSIRSGGTVLDPVVLGVRRGGDPLQYWMPGDPSQGRNASVATVTGMSGAGKSALIQMLLIDGVLSRGSKAEVEYWYLNSRKADQEPDWVKRGAARYESTRKGVAQALHDLYNEFGDRSRILGQQGMKEWMPGANIPFRVIICDEFADVATDLKKIFVNLSETVRSLGIHFVGGFQRASYDRFPTSARSNFNTQMCLGVQAEDDADMALPDEVLAAGASPWLWGAHQPGMIYMTAPGVPSEEWSEAARTFKPDDKLLAQWAEHYINLRDRGMSSAQPTPHPVIAGSVVATQAARPVNRPAADDDDLIDIDEPDDDLDEFDDTDVDDLAVAAEDVDVDPLDDDPDDVDGLLKDLNDELDSEDGSDLDEFDDVDLAHPDVPGDVAGELAGVNLRDEIHPGENTGGMRLALTPQMPQAEARVYVRTWLAGLYERGIVLVKKESMMGEVLGEVGYKASWLDKVLGEFIKEQPQWLRRSDSRGWYEILAAPPVLAGAAA